MWCTQKQIYKRCYGVVDFTNIIYVHPTKFNTAPLTFWLWGDDSVSRCGCQLKVPLDLHPALLILS